MVRYIFLIPRQAGRVARLFAEAPACKTVEAAMTKSFTFIRGLQGKCEGGLQYRTLHVRMEL